MACRERLKKGRVELNANERERGSREGKWKRNLKGCGWKGKWERE